MTYFDTFCDRVRAEALSELGGARRHARAGARSKTEAAIAGQDVDMIREEMKSYNQACVRILYIIQNGITDGVNCRVCVSKLKIENSVGEFPRACWAGLASATKDKCFAERPMTVANQRLLQLST